MERPKKATKERLISSEPSTSDAVSANDCLDKTVLANGVTIFANPNSFYRAAGLAVCIKGGLRDETPDIVGLTHLLEHLLLKRTRNKSPKDLACLMDDLGGDINAYTDTDSLCLFGTVPGERLGTLMDFFAELLLESEFREDELEVEKKIIRQEILESEDDPGEATYQFFCKNYWPDSMLALPVFGTTESVGSFTVENLKTRLSQLLKGKRILISAAGNFKPQELLKWAETSFGGFDSGDTPQFAVPKTNCGFELIHKPVSQCYVALGRQWPGFRHKDYLAGVVFSTLFGDAMSSRLFQIVREQKGLAYDISSEVDAHLDTGALSINLTLERSNLDSALELIFSELESIVQNGVSKEEFDRALRLMTAQEEMDADSLSGRMWRPIESMINLGRYISIDEVVKALRNLQLNTLEQMLENWLSPKKSLLVVGGDVAELKLDESIMQYCRKLQ